MYNTDFLCTYQLINDSEIDGTIDNNSEDLYRIQLLQAFNLHVWDDNTVNNIIKILYNNYKGNKLFVDLIKCGLYYSDEDPIIGFMSLFSYDTFHLFHRCLIDLNEGLLNKETSSYINLIKHCNKLNLEKPKV